MDFRNVRPFIRYTWFPEKGALVSIRPELSGGTLWDYGGTIQDWDVNAELQFELKGQTEIEIGYTESMERFEGVEFRKGDVSFAFETAWLTWLETSFGYIAARRSIFSRRRSCCRFLPTAPRQNSPSR